MDKKKKLTLLFPVGPKKKQFRFVPERLEECFSKYAGKGDGASTSSISMTPGEVAKKKAAAAAASLTLEETKGKQTSAGSVVDVGVRDSLTWSDIRLMLKGNRLLFDVFGTVAAFLEWGGLFWLAAQRRASDGRFVVTRERARAAADGTLFAVLKAGREREAEAEAAAKATGRGRRRPSFWRFAAALGGGGDSGAAAASVSPSAAAAVAKATSATAAKKKTGAAMTTATEGGGRGGIPAGRRTPPPPPASQVDFAPSQPQPPAAKAKKAQ